MDTGKQSRVDTRRTGELASEFDRLTPVIVEALPRLQGTLTLEGLYEMIERGDVQLWTGDKTFAVSYASQHETCRAVYVMLAGGDGKELLDVILPHIEEWGRQLRAKMIHMDVRPGFVRRGDHTKRGYTLRTMGVSKELSDG